MLKQGVSPQGRGEEQAVSKSYKKSLPSKLLGRDLSFLEQGLPLTVDVFHDDGDGVVLGHTFHRNSQIIVTSVMS